ncbi:MAG: hypothetical protein ACFHW5_20580 [Verrucomicrobiota bacterium]
MDTPTRDSCYNCHPEQHIPFLSGVMGTSIGEKGVHSMECQSCHGSMLDVGDEARTGWRDVPSCASCHTGSG